MFVVEDGDGICGYAVAAPDSKHFYEQFKKHWLPEVSCLHTCIILTLEACQKVCVLITQIVLLGVQEIPKATRKFIRVDICRANGQ